jgi:Family of unknown function (DUF6412)
VSALIRVVCLALPCAAALPGTTSTELVAGIAAMALAALVIARAGRPRVDAAPSSVAPTGCAAEATGTAPVTPLHQFDPDAAGHPRPRAPGRRMAVAAA